MRTSLSLLALIAICAVIWIVFFADDSAGVFFTSETLPEISRETVITEIETPDQTPGTMTVETILPSFDIVRISRNGTGVIAGRAEPHSDVFIYAGNRQIGAAVADRNGEWVLLYDNPLPSGPTELSLKSSMPGKFEVSSNDVVIVAVPSREEGRFNDDETNGVIVLLSDRKGGPTRVLQKPRLVNFAELAKGLSLDSLDFDRESNSVISGRAANNARVRIYLDNAFIAEAAASDEGRWSHAFVRDLDYQPHIIRIDQLLEDDDVEVRIEQPFTRGKVIDNSKAKGEVIVRPGNSLWHIARRLYGSGFHYTLIFGANKSQIKDPDLIYPGQKFSLPTAPVTE